MSIQKEIMVEIKNALETNSELTTLVGGTPNVFANFAEENTPCPYFIYRLDKIGNVDNGIGEARLIIRSWFYSSDSEKSYAAEDSIVRMLDKKYMTTAALKACRIWHLNEERKEGITKDYIKDRDAISIEMVFYLRWVSVPRVQALGGS